MTSTGSPVVSVALCTYNGERYIDAQLSSILAQTRPPAEIVVCDDDSADDTVRNIERIVSSAPASMSVAVLRNSPALGVVRNFERAVTATTGDVIALSDQDDAWHADKLSTMLDVLNDRPDVDLVHSDARLVDGVGRPLGANLFDYLEVSAADLAAEQSDQGFAVLLRRNLVTGATVVFRRRLLDHALPFPQEWVHDEWLAVIAAATGRVGAVTTATVDYRLHGSNEIGVQAPTLWHKINQVLGADAERNRKLAVKFAVLAERLRHLDVPASTVRLADQKAEFEALRAALPTSRIRRIPGILRAARAGLYSRFASQGRMDAVRDALRRP